MLFEWDEAKSAANASMRGLPFDLAILLFDGPTLETVDRRKDYGETRIRALGR
ncbi:MAG: BrnT family toxin, partial [Bacilli bacterium]